MEITFRKMGNSVGVIIPKAALKQLGAAAGTRANLTFDGDVATLRAVRHPREGWAEAAAIIGALPLTEEEQEWLDFGNDGDDELVW